MKRQLAAFVLVVVLAGAVQAQAYIIPGGAAAVIYPPQQPGIQYLGRLPNGIPVFNPWNMYNNLNNQQPIYVYNPSPVYPYVYNPYPRFFFNPYIYGGNNPYINLMVQNQRPIIQREPGRFLPAGVDLAINPISGTQLAPARGVALTNEGAFYRAPGSGSITGYGAYIPGSGVYVNPVNGDVYQPGTGTIIRR